MRNVRLKKLWLTWMMSMWIPLKRWKIAGAPWCRIFTLSMIRKSWSTKISTKNRQKCSMNCENSSYHFFCCNRVGQTLEMWDWKSKTRKYKCSRASSRSLFRVSTMPPLWLWYMAACGVPKSLPSECVCNRAVKFWTSINGVALLICAKAGGTAVHLLRDESRRSLKGVDSLEILLFSTEDWCLLLHRISVADLISALSVAICPAMSWMAESCSFFYTRQRLCRVHQLSPHCILAISSW